MNTSENYKKVWELIKGIDIAMLTTITDEGLVSRPMKTQEVEFDGDLWFITKKDTHKFDELKENPSVNVSYAGKSYVSIRGTAEIVNDREKIKQYWNKTYEKILQATSDDPNIILIKINAETAEYWDVGSWTKMVIYMFKRLSGKDTEGSEMNQIIEFSNK